MIKQLLLVGAGGALGSVARYLLTLLCGSMAFCGHWAILVANVVGSFLIGLAMGWCSGGAYLFVAVGFCGGFTTFSTFSAQALSLIEAQRYAPAAAYIAGSVLLSLLAVFMGIWLAHRLK